MSEAGKPQVCIVMGSHIGSADDGSGHRHAEGIRDSLHGTGVLSAHRTPNETLKLAEEARDNGIQRVHRRSRRRRPSGRCHRQQHAAAGHRRSDADKRAGRTGFAACPSYRCQAGSRSRRRRSARPAPKNAAILAAQMIGLADPAVMKKVEDFQAGAGGEGAGQFLPGSVRSMDKGRGSSKEIPVTRSKRGRVKTTAVS